MDTEKRVLDAEADLGGALVDGHRRGDFELNVNLFLLGIVFLAGRNQEKDGQQGQDKICFFHYLNKVLLLLTAKRQILFKVNFFNRILILFQKIDYI